MTYWIFKLSNQESYPDDFGRTYVYDNRHSVRVTANDFFAYLDKRGGGYAFTGHGVIRDVQSRSPGMLESRQPRLKRIYTAILGDFVRYYRPLDIQSNSADGKDNRSKLGITDVNRLGWSVSIAKINPRTFNQIVTLAYRQHHIPITAPEPADYEISDTWSLLRRRHSLERFRAAVLARQNYACAICGTTLKEVLDVAHISSYSTDIKNRANPANGIGLCAYCHRAFDSGVFRINEDGVVLSARDIEHDPVAEVHLSNLSSEARLKFLSGTDEEFLRKRFSGDPLSQTAMTEPVGILPAEP